MSLTKSFEPHAIETRWYSEWEKRGYFKPSGDTGKPAYCIQLPPPNVTGTLHMGHAFQQTLMDTLIRYHRMRGNNVNWIIGTDHAGIATQIVVERQLEAESKTRHDLGRDGFIKRVWEWKQQSGSTITRQMRRLGISANWDYASSDGQHAGYFTMDDRMSHAVVEAFVQLYEKGLIYRGKRLVNWDPILMTAVSDLEVESEEEDGKIWEINYPLANDANTSLVVATTRPETMLGDVAVAVHPKDERYKHLVGKQVQLPLTGRTIPVIADEYVDSKFGTGCVKITPGHDFNDYIVAMRHTDKIVSHISIFDTAARLYSVETLSKATDFLSVADITTLNDQNRHLIAAVTDDINKLNRSESKASVLRLYVPECYQGLDRFEARSRILVNLGAQGLLASEKLHKLRVPRSGRTGVIVEPMLTDQWFVKMDALAKHGLAAVADGRVKFHPEHWTSTYNQWLENIQDWCISRQLWWGHQIPAWYDEQGIPYVARNEEDAKSQVVAKGYQGNLKRDEDVLDTWFSSALIPFTSLGWPENTPDLKIFLPSSVLVTGFDIIFFWVARMIMMTLHFTGKVSFHDVYINALVRDAEGQKMSKSKGNTLDPIDLIDGIALDALLAKSTQGLLLESHKGKIEKYIRAHYPNGIPSFGADALRFTFASIATFARTLNFDLSRCEGYRNFCNKLWNATRFVLINCEGKDVGLDKSLPLDYSFIDRWIISRLQRAEAEIERSIADYRFDNAARAIYELVWDEYCDWYVELAKMQMQSGNEARQHATRRTLVHVLETILRLAHPIIPFITEELWQTVAPLAGQSGSTIMLAPYPRAQTEKIDEAAERDMRVLKLWTNEIRNLRGEANVPPSKSVPFYATAYPAVSDVATTTAALSLFARLSSFQKVDSLPQSNSPTAIIDNAHLMLAIEVDIPAERARLDKEIERLQSEIGKAQTKLKNLNFVDRAPATVVEQERKRLADHTSKLDKLRVQLDRLR
jgi:valyl-tRNA synthetase